MFCCVKNYLILAACGLLLLTACGTKSSKENTDSNSDTLVVGLQSGYPPFEYVDAAGKIVGFDVDIANKLAEKLGKKLVIQDMDFEAEILSLKSDKIDLIVSGMNITPGRLKEIDMIPYHGEVTSSLSLIFWDSIPEGINTFDDILALSNVSISVHLGSTSEEFLKKFPSLNIKPFQDSLSPLMDVKFGKSLANLVETPVATYLQHKHPQIKVLEIPLSAEDIIYGFGIGVNKANQQLFEQVSKAIQELKASGEMKVYEDLWFKGEA